MCDLTGRNYLKVCIIIILLNKKVFSLLVEAYLENFSLWGEGSYRCTAELLNGGGGRGALV